MSFHRANVTWQSPDGSWNIGFWTVLEADPEAADDEDYDDEVADGHDEEDEDYDDEWDAECGDDFEFVTTGHPTEESAWRTVDQHRPNPGSSHVYSLTNSSGDERAKLDELAAKCANRVLYTR